VSFAVIQFLASRFEEDRVGEVEIVVEAEYVIFIITFKQVVYSNITDGY
jgi:hypothetical protein